MLVGVVPNIAERSVTRTGLAPTPPNSGTSRRRPGSSWETLLIKAALRNCDLSNWTPAFAGEVACLKMEMLANFGEHRLARPYLCPCAPMDVGTASKTNDASTREPNAKARLSCMPIHPKGGIRRGRAPDSASGLHGS